MPSGSAAARCPASAKRSPADGVAPRGADKAAVIARERSDEAIQTRLLGLSLDCFVASLPRNDGDAFSAQAADCPVGNSSRILGRSDAAKGSSVKYGKSVA